MSTRADVWKTLAVGEEKRFEVGDLTRSNFVRYAGASGDFNPIHFDETFAQFAGQPSIFGQGMFTAGALSRIIASWFGPDAIKEYRTRFRERVWPGDTVHFSGKVAEIYEEGGVRHAKIELLAANQNGQSLVEGSAIVYERR